MEQERLLQKLFKWTLSEKRKQGRPWKIVDHEGMRQVMKNHGFTAEDVMDKHRWRLEMDTWHLAV